MIKMGRKKGKLTVRDKMWEQMRTLYVYGRLDVENREQVYPSQTTLAKEFNVPPSTIGYRARKGNWLVARTAAKEVVLDESRQKVADQIINSLTELNKQDLIILDAQIENYAIKLVAGKVDVSTTEVIKALALRRKIYHEIHGVPESEDRKPEVNLNVGVGVQIDFDGLTDKEQETLYNAVARNQVREKRSAEIDVIDAAPSVHVSSLDS